MLSISSDIADFHEIWDSKMTQFYQTLQSTV